MNTDLEQDLADACPCVVCLIKCTASKCGNRMAFDRVAALALCAAPTPPKEDTE